MKFTLEYAHAGVSQEKLNAIFQLLKPEIIRLAEARTAKNYAAPSCAINLPFDHHYQHTIQQAIEEKKALNPELLIVVGIGGSNLGTRALQEALLGTFYNQKNPSTKIYYADTVDSRFIKDILFLVKQALAAKKTILLNVVTKSGTTTETIALFEIFLEILLHYHPHDYANYIVVTTDRDSVLWHNAQEKKFTLLEIPQKVGGRYSVFSAVGLFPLGMLGINIPQLIEGASSIIPSSIALALPENYAAITAIVLYEQYKKDITIQDMFLFSTQLEGLGKWYRQLMGESIGKEYDVHGNKVEVGITPTVSLGTTDLHSVGQLYLGGPRNKGTAFVSIAHQDPTITVPFFSEFERAGAQVQGKSLDSIMHAILQGVKAAYKAHQRPFVSIILPECTEYYLGQFLHYKMIEMIYLGSLLQVNPFDQPNVESYKEETRKILANS